MKSFEFWFDFGSPASYLAWTQMSKLSSETSAECLYQPMLLGAVFQATGNHSPATIASKGRYIFDDFSRFAKRYGVPLQQNPFFPVNTLLVMRGAMAMQMHQPQQFLSYGQAVFEALWVHGQNMADPQVVAATVASIGLDPQQFATLCSDALVKEGLKAQTQKAVDKGVFGAPTFFVGEQMFWGQDRLDFVKEALL